MLVYARGCACVCVLVRLHCDLVWRETASVCDAFFALGVAHAGVLQLPQELWDNFAVTLVDLLLAMTIFRDEFDSRFLVLAVALLFLKSFHCAARLRVRFRLCAKCKRKTQVVASFVACASCALSRTSAHAHT